MKQISYAKLKKDYNYASRSALAMNEKIAQQAGTIANLQSELMKANSSTTQMNNENKRIAEINADHLTLIDKLTKQRDELIFGQNQEIKDLQAMIRATHQQIGYMTMQLGVMQQKLSTGTPL